ncbi:MAG TPA: protein phosphatase CheZ [Alphaproteobacteria bacterium]|nr:protein phosphatase CheZ [Alphaproteobacteria bacterium]
MNAKNGAAVDTQGIVGPGALSRAIDDILTRVKSEEPANRLKLYQQLLSLATYIEMARQDVAAIRPTEIQASKIPAVTDDLDAIVAHTEEATGVILDAAEKLENVAPKLDGESRTIVGDAVTRIYEACNFQDLTGQRITRVVKAVKDIEEKVDALITALHDQLGLAADELAALASVKETARPSLARSSTEKDLLNGPQNGPSAKSQEEIDRLFG